jgi:glycine/D-amino acid oxidase-like deaminating enzyme
VNNCSQPKSVAIVGGGIAGAALAYHLYSKGAQVAIFDEEPTSNTPPVAIVHPYPGRRYAWTLQEREAYIYAKNFYSTSNQRLGKLLVLDDLPMVRPFNHPSSDSADLLPAIGGPVIKNYSVAEIRENFPIVKAPFGANVYGGGFSILAQRFVQATLEKLRCSGVAVVREKIAAITSDNSGFALFSSFIKLGVFDDVIFALGASIKDIFKCPGFNWNAGSLLICSGSSDFRYLVSNKGHVAPGLNGETVIGSTYDHNQYENGSSAECEWKKVELLRLQSIQERLLYLSHSHETSNTLWHGKRATVPQDKLPVAGRIFNASFGFRNLNSTGSLWILGGLASRGFFWAPWLARQLSEDITELATTPALPSLFAPQRIKGWKEPKLLQSFLQIS